MHLTKIKTDYYSIIYLYLLKDGDIHLTKNINDQFFYIIKNETNSKISPKINRYRDKYRQPIRISGNIFQNSNQSASPFDRVHELLIQNGLIDVITKTSVRISKKGNYELEKNPYDFARLLRDENKLITRKKSLQKLGRVLRKKDMNSPQVRVLDSTNVEIASEEKQHQIIEVFFGTDRAVDADKKIAHRFTNSRGSQLSLGAVKVNIPKLHKIGTLERPKWSHLEWSVNPSKHFILLDSNLMIQDDFENNIKEYIQNSNKKSAFVFVHGYNVSFEDAALRTAQIAIDLDLKSVPSFFSWPSQGGLLDYLVDESNVEWTEPNLQKFLEIFSTASQADEIYIIAHSMGSRAVVRSLSKLLEELKSLELHSIFRELILAAPDIDAAVFKNTLLPNLLKMQQRVTLYASSNDNALIASKKIHGSPRAGDSQPSIVVADGLDTIDASSVETDFLGHSYLTNSRPLLTDLALLINNNMPVAKRPTLVSQINATNQYWSFKP